jgi:hypothetical protein
MNSGSCWLTFSVAVGGLVLADSILRREDEEETVVRAS